MPCNRGPRAGRRRADDKRQLLGLLGAALLIAAAPVGMKLGVFNFFGRLLVNHALTSMQDETARQQQNRDGSPSPQSQAAPSNP